MSERMSLYALSLEGVQIADILETNEGELTPELAERLDALMKNGPESVEAAAVVVQNLLASALVCQQEALRLKARAESFDKNAARLKERMTIALDCAFNGRVKTSRFTMWTQKSADRTAFDLKEEATLEQLYEDHPEFVRVKLELNKAALEEANKAGDLLPEAVFVEHVEGRRSVRIK